MRPTVAIKEPIQKIMQDLAKKNKPGSGPQLLWSRVVEKRALKHTRVVGLKKGSLIINVDNSSWLYELNTRQEKILEELKKLSAEFIKDIKFRLGRMD